MERERTQRDLLRQQVAAEKLPMSRAPEVKPEPGSSMLEQAVTYLSGQMVTLMQEV